MLLKFLVFAAVFSTYRCQLGGLCPNILDDINECMADSISNIADLNSYFSTASSVLSFQSPTTVLNAVCTYKAQLEKFYRCFYTKFLACIPSDWTKALASTDKVINSISYLCDNAEDIDLPCASNNLQNVTNCFSTVLSGTQTGNLTTVDDYVSFACRIYPSFENCHKSCLSVCGGRTSEVLAGYMNYRIPAACDATLVRVSWALLVISICYTWIKNMVRG